MKIQTQFNFNFTIDGDPYDFRVLAHDEKTAKEKLEDILNKILKEINELR